MKETDHSWISISFNDSDINIEYDSPNAEKWVKKISWNDITRICYKSYDYGAPDFLYLSLENSEEQYIIPLTEKGGKTFWEEVRIRGMFDQKLAIIAEGSWNKIICWPD